MAGMSEPTPRATSSTAAESSSNEVTHRVAGDALITIDIALTALFGITAAYAAAVFSTAAQWIGAITAMALFAIGVFSFLWAYWNAVQRSREEEISVTGLFFLLGDPIPKPVRRVMLSLLITQFVIAAITTIARPDGPDGNPGSSLAVGFLVPMLGFGLNGLWAAYHGDFPARVAAPGRRGRTEGVPAERDQIGQNADHG